MSLSLAIELYCNQLADDSVMNWLCSYAKVVGHVIRFHKFADSFLFD